MKIEDYESENVFVAFCSDMTATEAESLIGKTVAKVDATEHCLELQFSDGSTVSVSGVRWGGSSMGITFEEEL